MNFYWILLKAPPDGASGRESVGHTRETSQIVSRLWPVSAFFSPGPTFFSAVAVKWMEGEPALDVFMTLRGVCGKIRQNVAALPPLTRAASSLAPPFPANPRRFKEIGVYRRVQHTWLCFGGEFGWNWMIGWFDIEFYWNAGVAPRVKFAEFNSL